MFDAISEIDAALIARSSGGGIKEPRLRTRRMRMATMKRTCLSISAHELAGQVLDRGEDPSGDNIALDPGKPVSYLIEPGGVGRSVVEMDSGVSHQELLLSLPKARLARHAFIIQPKSKKLVAQASSVPSTPLSGASSDVKGLNQDLRTCRTSSRRSTSGSVGSTSS
jgi:hypothetical protein